MHCNSDWVINNSIIIIFSDVSGAASKSLQNKIMVQLNSRYLFLYSTHKFCCVCMQVCICGCTKVSTEVKIMHNNIITTTYNTLYTHYICAGSDEPEGSDIC